MTPEPRLSSGGFRSPDKRSAMSVHVEQVHSPTGLQARRSKWGMPLALAAAFTLYFFVSRPVGHPAGWGEDFDAALQQAAAADKNIVVAFHSDGCPPCAAMDRTVLPSEAVQRSLGDFIPVRVNVAYNLELARRYFVQVTPTYAVLSPSGKLLARTDGYHTEEMFIAFLQQAHDVTRSSGPTG